MNFFSDDGPGYIAEDQRDRAAARGKANDGTILYQVGNDSNIESAIHEVHRKYKIPADEEHELARLIFRYEQARNSLNRAHSRWATHRGKDRYDLEYMLKEEGVELESLLYFQEEYRAVAFELQKYLSGTETRFPGRMPPWEQEHARTQGFP